MSTHTDLTITRGPIGSRTIVSRSRNLRGLLTYARKSPVFKVTLSDYGRTDGGCSVYVQFDDGCECRTEFASFTVAKQFFRSRRSWDVSECYCSPNMTVFH